MLTDSNPTNRINIQNDEEILLLPLVSLVYRLEQSDDIDNDKSHLIGDLDGIKNEYYQVKGNSMDD